MDYSQLIAYTSMVHIFPAQQSGAKVRSPLRMHQQKTHFFSILYSYLIFACKTFYENNIRAMESIL